MTERPPTPVAGFGLIPDGEDQGDRNGEPSELDLTCLVTLFCLVGVLTIVCASLIFILASGGG